MILSLSQVNSVKHAHYYRCQGGDLYYLDNNKRARLEMERESIGVRYDWFWAVWYGDYEGDD